MRSPSKMSATNGTIWEPQPRSSNICSIRSELRRGGMEDQWRTDPRKYPVHAFAVQDVGDHRNNLGAATQVEQHLLDLEHLHLATLHEQQAQGMNPRDLPAELTAMLPPAPVTI